MNVTAFLTAFLALTMAPWVQAGSPQAASTSTVEVTSTPGSPSAAATFVTTAAPSSPLTTTTSAATARPTTGAVPPRAEGVAVERYMHLLANPAQSFDSIEAARQAIEPVVGK